MSERKYRLCCFLMLMVCMWGGSYLLYADFTPAWMTTPIFMTTMMGTVSGFVGMFAGRMFP